MNADGMMRIGYAIDAADSPASLARCARRAEQAKLDLVLHDDKRPRQALEPMTLLSALAGATTRIGLAGAANTNFSEPYNVARQIASLDRLSHGRGAWRVTTAADADEGRRFGQDAPAPRETRHARAREFVEVVTRLWDSWEDDAFIRDRALGLTFDPAKQHKLVHQGRFFTLDGALNIERSVQGRPVIILGAGTPAGRALAAEVAEVVCAEAGSLAEARAVQDDLRLRAAAFGREAAAMKIMIRCDVVFGGAGETARALADRMEDWFGDGAADGFMLSFPAGPAGLDTVCAEVVPDLQRRGVFRTEYAGTTLRAQLGLRRPAHPHAAAA